MNTIHANFWHLKAKNGMFYYGRDCVEALSEDLFVKVVARRGVLAREDFSDRVEVVELGFFGYLNFVFKALFCRFFVYTPTLHALPFLPNQVVTLHDLFPLTSWYKMFFWKLTLVLSGCAVGCINRSVSMDFVLNQTDNFCFFIPNILEPGSKIKKIYEPSCHRILNVALVGTDSRKKDYSTLLEEISKIDIPINLVVYGTFNDYFVEVRDLAVEKKISLEFVDSSMVALNEFFKRDIDVVVSIARNEGFCRPCAQAAVSGVPQILINDPVFEEFYSNVALFISHPDELPSALKNIKSWVMTIDFERSVVDLRNDLDASFKSGLNIIIQRAGGSNAA